VTEVRQVDDVAFGDDGSALQRWINGAVALTVSAGSADGKLPLGFGD
jgi:hypothetical protein